MAAAGSPTAAEWKRRDTWTCAGQLLDPGDNNIRYTTSLRAPVAVHYPLASATFHHNLLIPFNRPLNTSISTFPVPATDQ